nr:hypothetical protein [Tanacetum cinerariifolium]
MTRNRRLFTSYKEYDGRHIVFRSNIKGKVIGQEDDGINKQILQDLNRSSSLEASVSNEGNPKKVKEAKGQPIKQVISVEIPIILPSASEAGVTLVTSPAGVFDLIVYSSIVSDSHLMIPLIVIHLSLSSLDSHEIAVSHWRGKVASRSLPSSSTHDLPSTNIASPTPHRIVPTPPGVPLRPAILVLPSQKSSFGRPYCTQPNGVHRMLTAKKRVHPFSARIPANRRRFYSSSSSPPRKRHRASSYSSSSDSPAPAAMILSYSINTYEN